MRDISSGLQADLDAGITTLAKLWRVTRADGTVLRFTTATSPVVWNGDTYRADISFDASAIFTSSVATNAQSVTVTVGMSADGFVERELRARLFDGALGEVMVINYEAPAHGVITLFVGTVGIIKLADKLWAQIELTPISTAGRSIGFARYSQTCRHSLGDTGCGVNIGALKQAITVDAVSGNVIVASELTQADEHWTLGYVKWLTGANAGTAQVINSSSAGTTSVTLTGAPLLPVTVGDTAEVFPGCDKAVKTCLDKFAKVANFDGEPDVPGQQSFTYTDLAQTQTFQTLGS